MGLHVGKNFLESFPERSYSAKLIVKLNEAKRLGEKTGSGFYQYDAKRKAKPDPALAPIVEASRKVSRSHGHSEDQYIQLTSEDALQPAMLPHRGLWP